MQSAQKTNEKRKSRLSVIGRALRPGFVRRDCSPSIAALTESVALVAGLLKRVAKMATEPAAATDVAEALTTTLTLLEDLSL